MTVPLLTAQARAAHATFRALLDALSRPGTVQLLPEGNPFQHLAGALLDLEVSVFTADEDVRALLRTTGVQFRPVSEADYLFFTAWTPDVLHDIERARVGTPLDPHHSATIILPARIGEGEMSVWHGPGIEGHVNVCLGGLPAGGVHDLLALRRQHAFPLGWDVFFVDDVQVIGLPRTTQVQELT